MASCPSSASNPPGAASGSIGCARPMGLVDLPSEASVPSGWFIAALASPNLSKSRLFISHLISGLSAAPPATSPFCIAMPKAEMRLLRPYIFLLSSFTPSLYCTGSRLCQHPSRDHAPMLKRLLEGREAMELTHFDEAGRAR